MKCDPAEGHVTLRDTMIRSYQDALWEEEPAEDLLLKSGAKFNRLHRRPFEVNRSELVWQHEGDRQSERQVVLMM